MGDYSDGLSHPEMTIPLYNCAMQEVISWHQEFTRLSVSALGIHVITAPVAPPVPRTATTSWLGQLRMTESEFRERRMQLAKQLVIFVARQFQMELPRIAIRFARLEGHAARVHRKQDTWYIDIQDQRWADFEQLASVLAHEMAHVVLDKRGIRLIESQRNEELTDSIAIFAGFGPLMLRANERTTTRHYVVATQTETTRVGYLRRSHIARLARIRGRIAGHVVRRVWTPICVSETRAFFCPACGTQSVLPTVDATIIQTCHTCGSRFKLFLETAKSSTVWSGGLRHLKEAVDRLTRW